MNYLFIYLSIYMFYSCEQLKTSHKYHKEEKQSTETIISKDSPSLNQGRLEFNTQDSLIIGAIFYDYNAFNKHKFIETEPYEFTELNNDNNSTQIMIYLKSDRYYVILISAENNVDKFGSDFTKTKKTIVDMISYDAKFELCWYIYDGNHPPLARFGIGTKANKHLPIGEYLNCEVYKRYKLFHVDYKKGKFEEIHINDSTFCCSDGY